MQISQETPVYGGCFYFAERKVMPMRRKRNAIRDDQDLQTILICAVRYSLGRATYMPRLVTDWIMEHCEGQLNENTLTVMMRDIDEMRRRHALGMDCDITTWLRFYGWLRRERGDDGTPCDDGG